MKKKLISILCISMIFILAGCSTSDKKADKSMNDTDESQAVKEDSENHSSETKENSDIVQAEDNKNDAKGKKDTSLEENKEKSTKLDKTADSKKIEENSDNNSQDKKDTVKSKVKLYEGTYFDDKVFGENTLSNYCEIKISNLTDTSFDFAIYEVNVSDGKEDRKIIFNKNTAVFTGSGTEAAFYGKDYTLSFTFPDNHRAYPIATDMQVSGFKPLEGKTYVNNGIPGHEFG